MFLYRGKEPAVLLIGRGPVKYTASATARLKRKRDSLPGLLGRYDDGLNLLLLLRPRSFRGRISNGVAVDGVDIGVEGRSGDDRFVFLVLDDGFIILPSPQRQDVQIPRSVILTMHAVADAEESVVLVLGTTVRSSSNSTTGLSCRVLRVRTRR
jgi:hypothetical protein